MLKCKNSDSQIELVQKKLDEGHEIRPFPASVTKLLAAIRDEKAKAQTFAAIIELDVALATRILRIVNSPLYGFSNEIRSINQAVTVLGRRPLKNIALTYSGAAILSGTKKSKQQCEALWFHSLGCATVARQLAKSVASVSPDEAFLAGIFHDIGKLFFLDVIPIEYSILAASHFGEGLQARESKLCGLTHEEVGLRLTVTWPLPNEIKGAIRYHHAPEADSVESKYPALIHVADGLARSRGIGSPADPAISMVQKADRYFGLNEIAVQSIEESAFAAFEDSMQAFSG